MTLRPETIRVLRATAFTLPGNEVPPGPIVLTVEEARELYEDYTTARMFESAAETFKRRIVALETREKALHTQLAAANTKLAALEAAELRGAERLIPNVVCTCRWFDPDHTGRVRVDDTDCPTHGRKCEPTLLETIRERHGGR